MSAQAEIDRGAAERTEISRRLERAENSSAPAVAEYHMYGIVKDFVLKKEVERMNAEIGHGHSIFEQEDSPDGGLL